MKLWSGVAKFLIEKIDSQLDTVGCLDCSVWCNTGLDLKLTIPPFQANLI